MDLNYSKSTKGITTQNTTINIEFAELLKVLTLSTWVSKLQRVSNFPSEVDHSSYKLYFLKMYIKSLEYAKNEITKNNKENEEQIWPVMCLKWHLAKTIL